MGKIYTEAALYMQCSSLLGTGSFVLTENSECGGFEDPPDRVSNIQDVSCPIEPANFQ